MRQMLQQKVKLLVAQKSFLPKTHNHYNTLIIDLARSSVRRLNYPSLRK